MPKKRKIWASDSKLPDAVVGVAAQTLLTPALRVAVLGDDAAAAAMTADAALARWDSLDSTPLDSTRLD